MGLTIKDVEHVATLARLELAPGEAEVFARQLGAILEYMRQLDSLDTEGVEPTSHVLPLVNVFREDRVVPGGPREEILAQAPDSERGHFKVPRVVENPE
jgi:aspartyl-tRNA(Asn)/glutamyl-tRNA(Gln) amidotransferase subunit C